MSDAILIQGAEAVVEATEWMGRPVIRKSRLVKPYRHPELDARLRNERTRDEASILFAARRAGVPVPVVYDVDRTQGAITMEPIQGPPLRDVLPNDADHLAAERMRHLGAIIAALHDADLTHGDLTTSNILVPHPEDARSLVMIDFGLGQITNEGEDKAVDLHLVEEALEATDSRAPELMHAFLDGYAATAAHPDDVLRRLEGVRERGRYRGAS